MFKRVILYIIIIFGFGYLFLIGYMQPKYIFMENIKIEGVGDSFLVYAEVDGEEIQWDYFPIIFRKQYSFPKIKSTHFIFKGSKSNILDIEFLNDIKNTKKFNLLYSTLLKDKKYEVVNEDECIIYLYSYDDMNHNISLFNKKRLIRINIMSNVDIKDKYISLFCK